jgi:uncharacterized membrane protein
MFMDEISRYREIDLARGIAILMMILFHTVFDLNFFRIFPVDVSFGFWRYFAFATASLFLLIVGISLTISRARIPANVSTYQRTLKFVQRGSGIFLLGLLVTVCTWLYLKEGVIVFGILHLIGVSVILSPLFFRFKKINIIFGFLCIFIGCIFTTMNGPIWLLPLGIHPATFWSVDYEPIFPWFGIVLIGMGLGELLYPGSVRRFTLPQIPEIFVRPLACMGRHSLIIYLVHQPLIILAIAAATGIKVL